MLSSAQVIVRLSQLAAPVGVVPIHIGAVSQLCFCPCKGCARGSTGALLVHMRQAIVQSGILRGQAAGAYFASRIAMSAARAPIRPEDFFFEVSKEGGNIEAGSTSLQFALCHCQVRISGGE